MIRSEFQHDGLQRQLRRFLTHLDALKARVREGDEQARVVLKDERRHVEELQRALDEYAILTDSSSEKRAIAAWDFETGEPAFADALFAMRRAAGLQQEQLAERLNKTQSAVARLESPNKDNYETRTLQAWAEAAGYQLMPSFVKPGGGYNDPGSIISLGVEAAQIKGFFPEGHETALRAFLRRLQHHTQADLVTCYIADPACRRLQLVHMAGVLDEQKMRGQIRRTDVTWKLLLGSPEFIADATAHPTFGESDFTRREGVKSVCYLPFWSQMGPGILFLNYRRQMELPSPEYWGQLQCVPDLLVFLLGGGTLGERTQALPQEGVLELEQRIVRILGDLKPEGADRPGRDWQRQEIMDILRHAMQWMKLEHTRCALYIVEGDHLVLRNGIPEPQSAQKLRIDGTQGIVCRAVQERKPLVINDLQEERWRDCYVPLAGSGPMRSKLVVPFFTRDSQEVIGVITLESPEPGAFGPVHARQLERMGQMMSTILDTRDVLAKLINLAPPRSHRRDRMMTLVHVLLERVRTANVTQEQLKAVVDLIIDLFGADIVDIWPIDWSRRDTPIDVKRGFHKTAQEFIDKHGYVDPEKLAPRAQYYTAYLITDPQCKPLIIENAVRDALVSPETVGLGIKSLVGVAIFGQGSCPDGVMWIRFERQRTMAELQELAQDAQVIAGFVHLLWNPMPLMDSVPECGLGALTAA